MEQVLADVLGNTYLPPAAIAGRLLGAAVLGAAIGLDREWRDRTAGLRTHVLTSLAAAVFTLVTIEITMGVLVTGEAAQADPIRVIEAVTAGVAFLAAGAIIQGRGRVHGLTTGAGMWLAGAVGVAAGLGQWIIGVAATLVGVFVIVVLRKFEPRPRERRPEGGRAGETPAAGTAGAIGHPQHAPEKPSRPLPDGPAAP